MDVEYSYDTERGVLIAKITGTYKISKDTSIVRQVVDMLRECNCSRLLFDYRDAKFVVDTLPAYDRPKVLEDLGVERSTKFASVYRELNEDTHYTESVYRNRGWRMKDFSDYDAAIEWLTR
jgi:hypothetical protein